MIAFVVLLSQRHACNSYNQIVKNQLGFSALVCRCDGDVWILTLRLFQKAGGCAFELHCEIPSGVVMSISYRERSFKCII